MQAVISPSVGAVMDYITEMQGQVIFGKKFHIKKVEMMLITTAAQLPRCLHHRRHSHRNLPLLCSQGANVMTLLMSQSKREES